jgi:hypothetical protein
LLIKTVIISLRTAQLRTKHWLSKQVKFMEIKRNIYNKIADWKKQTNGTKALLIEGARRIGKSTVAEKFAKNEYKTYILIDFNKAEKKVKDAFNYLENIDVFFSNSNP